MLWTDHTLWFIFHQFQNYKFISNDWFALNLIQTKYTCSSSSDFNHEPLDLVVKSENIHVCGYWFICISLFFQRAFRKSKIVNPFWRPLFCLYPQLSQLPEQLCIARMKIVDVLYFFVEFWINYYFSSILLCLGYEKSVKF